MESQTNNTPKIKSLSPKIHPADTRLLSLGVANGSKSFVYILTDTERNQFVIGITSRFTKLKRYLDVSSSLNPRYGTPLVDKLVYYKKFSEPALASAWLLELNHFTKLQKQRLILSKNKNWINLWREILEMEFDKTRGDQNEIHPFTLNSIVPRFYVRRAILLQKMTQKTPRKSVVTNQIDKSTNKPNFVNPIKPIFCGIHTNVPSELSLSRSPSISSSISPTRYASKLLSFSQNIHNIHLKKKQLIRKDIRIESQISLFEEYPSVTITYEKKFNGKRRGSNFNKKLSTKTDSIPTLFLSMSN